MHRRHISGNIVVAYIYKTYSLIVFFKLSDLFNPQCYPVYLVLTYCYSQIATAQ